MAGVGQSASSKGRMGANPWVFRGLRQVVVCDAVCGVGMLRIALLGNVSVRNAIGGGKA